MWILFSYLSNAKSKKGFGLIEVMVAVGILAFASLGFITLVANQSREVRSVDEKMALQNIQTQLGNVLSSSRFCSCMIGNNTFDDTAGVKAWNSLPTQIGSTYTAPPAACAMVGSPWLTVGVKYGDFIKPTAIRMQNIVDTASPANGTLTGDLVIDVDPGLMVRSRKSITVPLYFSVNTADPVNARTLLNCTTNISKIDLQALCPQIGGVYNPTGNPPCQPTYQ